MKLESLSIRDFRGIESLDPSFKDELGLIRDRVPIVGPNTSGKTSILDAITLCLMPFADYYQTREGLRMSPRSLVRSGAVRASVSATVWLSDNEIDATKEVIARSEAKGHPPIPSDGRVTVHWT
jgi:predicted ATP-dependent endonuclease of OLD family